MYPFLLKKLNAIYLKLGSYLHPEENVQPETATLPYHSLSPITNAEATHYTNAIRWALDNRKKESIYNIALTGPYGSGKSSILQTFKATNTNPDYVFLEISLATFKEEIDMDEDTEGFDNDKVGGNEGNARLKKVRSNEDILRLIELSILQQIFYHEEDERIPDSRFKKIRSFKKKSLRFITIGVMLALTFGLNLFYPEKVQTLLMIEFDGVFGMMLHWLSLCVFLTALFFVIYRSIRLFYGLKVSKLKFQEAEIEIDKNISKSILNNHLDEILYFFEVTDYSVVLIEDLDRFRQAEIFTKLRELNLLINKSKKIDQAVVFIYAVRDEIFRDKDRTKFFDFIIPVIPVINGSNSNDKLIKLVIDNNYNISNDLIDDVSLFIDDMRLLYNIINEFHIYGSLLDSALNQDKLLAMIVYKNIFPDDFVLLNDGSGKLFDLIRKRSEYVSNQIREIDDEIKELKDEIRQIERNQFKNGDELRWLYVARFVNKTNGFQYFNFSGSPSTMEDAATRERFDYFRRGNFNYLCNPPLVRTG
ncbi:hypothetical protein, partial [Mucilaginibacter endophyticus]|uniref:YobI family P-loop NTPase n=1 Tax=Mucilaginibacter endophyticus TaxID=2675003 RepID=UPI001ABF5CAB